MLKASNSRFLDPETSNSNFLASRGVKSFEFEVFGPQDVEFESIRPGAWPQDVKSFEFEVFGPQDFEFETFSIQGHDPRMLKASNSEFWDPKTTNSKLLTSWGHAPGY